MFKWGDKAEVIIERGMVRGWMARGWMTFPKLVESYNHHIEYLNTLNLQGGKQSEIKIIKAKDNFNPDEYGDNFFTEKWNTIPVDEYVKHGRGRYWMRDDI